ncbi:uncharacterized protein LOC119375339 [Rhipicephalus sanguineus]|uniref:uncharacterized protein LOC119375339 n=1 Tax=Rhipicephalus sanguineus TaxID=34632 RepID=UPI001894B652|nr:uncharacterized protein LOC119375339 [Rhipicephalus sanguineus]
MQLAKRFTRIVERIAVFKSHLDFNRTCKENGVIPHSLRLKRPVSSSEGIQIIRKTEQRLLTARIRECNAAIKKKELDVFFARRQLEHRIPDIMPSLEDFAKKSAATEAKKHKVAQDKKLGSILRDRESATIPPSTFVTNLSSRHLSTPELAALAKGHGFNISAIPPISKIVAAVEDGIQHLEAGARQETRLKVIGVLSKIPARLSSNLPDEERKALIDLKKDKTIVVLPADKGNSTVVMDRADYEKRAGELLNGEAYSKIKKDPTPQTQTNLKRLLSQIFTNHPDFKNLYLKLICRNGSAPSFYGLPKVHKSGIPLRPIVDFTRSPLRALSSYLHRYEA